MTWLIVWFLLSIAVAVFANNRGRDAGRWFLLSIIISPVLGLIFLAVSKDLREEEQAKANTPGPNTHIKCPHCAEWVLPEASVCKHCHSALQPDPNFASKIASQKSIQAALDIKTRRIYLGIIAGIVGAFFLVSGLIAMSS